MPATNEQLEEWADQDSDDALFHPVATFVDGHCVGASGALSFQITIPGGSTLGMAGVTGTGVIATHRRRGYLRHMMQLMFDEALERGEPLAMLSASEGSIYGNFGFSPATYRTRWEIDRHEAAFHPTSADEGTLRLVSAAEAKTVWPSVHAEMRATRIGELTPLPTHWDNLSDIADGTNGPLRYLMHQDSNGDVDGIANFRLPWSSTVESAGTLIVEALEATTAQAYRALWQLLLDFDLTKTVVAPGRPRDEPLRWMLTNPRALRVTRQSDNLWARILDLPGALGARSYSAEDSLIIQVVQDDMCPRNVGSWHLGYEDGVSWCDSTTHSPDLVASIGALSTLYLGGMSASDLAYAGHITGITASSVPRLHALFRTDSEPHNSFGF